MGHYRVTSLSTSYLLAMISFTQLHVLVLAKARISTKHNPLLH